MKLGSLLVGVGWVLSTYEVLAKYTAFDDTTFEKGIQHGFWFIKHYTQWCGFSKRLKPDWEVAYTKLASKESENFYFGEVDCDKGKNTCDINKISGYPTLLLFKDGKLVEEYLGGYSLAEFTAYVEEQIKKAKKDASKPVVKPVSPDEIPTSKINKTDQDFYDKIQTQYKTLPLFKGEVLDLTANKFNETLGALYSGAWMVEFYSPLCPHCQAFKPSYEQLASKTKGQVNLARVDCIEFEDFCGTQNVQGVPDLRMFKNGKQVLAYKDSRDLNILEKFMKSFYLPQLDKVDQKNIAEKKKLLSKSASPNPFLVLSTENIVTQFNNTQKIREYLEGVDVQSDFLITEDDFAGLESKAKFDGFSLKAIHGEKELVFQNPLLSNNGFNYGLRTWVSMNHLPLGFKLTSQLIKSLNVSHYQVVIGFYDKSFDLGVNNLEKTLRETNLAYQTKFDFKSANSKTLPLLFCYLPDHIAAIESKQILESLNIPFDQVSSFGKGLKFDFILVDSSQQKFQLISKAASFKYFELLKPDSLLESLHETQVSIHMGEPLGIDKSSGSPMLTVICIMAILGLCYFLYTKKKQTEEIQYAKLM